MQKISNVTRCRVIPTFTCGLNNPIYMLENEIQRPELLAQKYNVDIFHIIMIMSSVNAKFVWTILT